MPNQPLHILMLAAGIALAFCGLLMARTGNVSLTARLSISTRAVIGLCLAVLGYHLIVWVFPPSLTPVQTPRQFWWVMIGAMILLPIGSVALDRWLARRGGDSGSNPSRDDSNPIR